MKTAILDTNFIMTCIKQKIDFFEDVTNLGFRILIPTQVINELKKLSIKNEGAKLSLKLLKKENDSFEKINLEKYGKTTDKRIINFAKEHFDVVIGTLDKEIKDKTENNKIVIRGKKKLEVV